MGKSERPPCASAGPPKQIEDLFCNLRRSRVTRVIRFGTLAPENGRQVSFVRLPDASWTMAARRRGHEPLPPCTKGCNLYKEVHRAHFGVAYVQKSAKEMDQQATTRS